MATFDEWLVAYDAVYRALPHVSDTACPNCHHATLCLVFTKKPKHDVGYAAFWCDTCLHGIHISRALIPAGSVVRSMDASRAQRLPAVPDYIVVS